MILFFFFFSQKVSYFSLLLLAELNPNKTQKKTTGIWKLQSATVSGFDLDDHDNAKGFQDTKCTIKPSLFLVIVFICKTFHRHNLSLGW